MKLIAFLTDFGTEDTYVAQMKSVVWQICPEARCLDVTHEVPPQDVWSGGYHLATILPQLPEGAILVAVIDPGVGSYRRILVARFGNVLVLAPDNGLLSLARIQQPASHLRALKSDLPESTTASATFHGRDLFSPIAAKLARGDALDQVSDPLDRTSLVDLPVVACLDQIPWQLRLLCIDHFGNAILNLPTHHLQGMTRIEIAGDSWPIHRTFCDVAPGERVAYPGSSGWLELAIRNGNAARNLGHSPGQSLEATPC